MSQKHLSRKKKRKLSQKEISDHTRPSFFEKHRILAYFTLILIPVLFFSLLESGLRYFDYGRSHQQWVESPNGQWIQKGGQFLLLNPDIAYKYFHALETIPHPTHLAFDKEKAPNAFRVFILGGSSAAGFPYEPNGSVASYLLDRLSLVYADSKIEVVNCGMTAINSYSIRDLTPGILAQKPDLILIYAGHNEYYGALGAGSIESFGNSRFLANLAISLEEYRTFQLLRNALAGIIGKFTTGNGAQAGTMMEKMVRKKQISYGSDVYKKGLAQFEGNLSDILKMITDADVPVIIGAITSNLKDQPPFISESFSQYPPANEIFHAADLALSQNKFKLADSLFRYARDLDALRFRAPGRMNEIISRTAKKYNVEVVDVDSAFNAISPNQIVGSNLIIDHLHPSLQGYQLMGKMFFNKMEALKYLPDTRPKNIRDEVQDSLTIANLNFSKLDSVMSDFKIRLLGNNWPFVEDKVYYPHYIKAKDRIDSLAILFLESRTNWLNAHLSAAEWYYARGDIDRFLNEMDALIYRYPHVIEYPNLVSEKLQALQKYDQMYGYLQKSYAIRPGAYSTKWLGTINLYNGDIPAARRYLSESLNMNSSDPQVWYNLALSHYNYDKRIALEYLDKALAVAPNYKSAIELRERLTTTKE